MFAYIVEEARGANSNFKILVCSPLGWLSGTASLKYIKNFKYVTVAKPIMDGLEKELLSNKGLTS